MSKETKASKLPNDSNDLDIPLRTLSEETPFETPIKKNSSTDELGDAECQELLEISSEQDDLETDLRDPKTFPWILISLYLNITLSALDGTLVSTTLNEIASSFQQASMVSWIATSYLLTTTAVQPLYGKTSDILGRKRCLLFSEIIFGIGIIFCSVSNSIPQLALARAISGIGGSGLSAMCNIILSDMVPLSERSLYWGYGSVIWGASQSVGGPLGGILFDWFGVRGLFIVQVPFCLLSIFLSWRYVVDYSPYSIGSWERIDFAGSFALITSVSSFVYAISVSGDTEDNGASLTHVICGIISVIALFAFILIEKYVAKECILPFYILKGSLGVVGFLNMLISLLLYVPIFIIPLYQQLVWGLTVSESGNYLIYTVFATSFGGLFAGWILRKLTPPTRDGTLWTTGSLLVYSTFIASISFFAMYYFIGLIKPTYESGGPTFIQKFSLFASIVVMGLFQGFQEVAVVLYNVAKVGRKGQATSTSVTFLFRSLGNVLCVSVSFSVFISVLKRKLREMLSDNDSELFTKLLKDTAYVRDPEFPKKYLKPTLDIFKDALYACLWPSNLSAALSIICVIILYLMVRKYKNRPARNIFPMA